MLQGKRNIYDFYHVLLQKTDSTNISDTIVSDFISLDIYLKLIILLSSIETKSSIVYTESGET